jgi:hypothetical protein
MSNDIERMNAALQQLHDNVQINNSAPPKSQNQSSTPANTSDANSKLSEFGKGLGGVIDELALTGIGLRNFKNATESAGDAMKLIASKTGLLGKGLGFLTDQILANQKDMQAAAKQGIGGGDWFNLNANIQAAGTTLDDLKNTMQQSNGALNHLGQNQDEAATKLLQLGQQVQESTIGRDLKKFSDMHANELAKYAGIMALTSKANMNEQRDREQLANAAARFAKELDETARLTGKSRESLAEEVRKRDESIQMQMIKTTMDKDQAEAYGAVKGSLADVGPQIENVFVKLMTGNALKQTDIDTMAAMGGTAAEEMRQAAAMAREAGSDETKQQQAKAKLDLALLHATEQQMDKSQARHAIAMEDTPLGQAYYKTHEALLPRIEALQGGIDKYGKSVPLEEVNKRQRDEIDQARLGKDAAGNAKPGQALSAEYNELADNLRASTAGTARSLSNFNQYIGKSPELIKDFNTAINAAVPNHGKVSESKTVYKPEELEAKAKEAFEKYEPLAKVAEKWESVVKDWDKVAEKLTSAANSFLGLFSSDKDKANAAPATPEEQQKEDIRNKYRNYNPDVDDLNKAAKDANTHNATGTINTTGSYINDYGTGTPAMLHGKEGVLTEDQLLGVIDKTAQNTTAQLQQLLHPAQSPAKVTQASTSQNIPEVSKKAYEILDKFDKTIPKDVPNVSQKAYEILDEFKKTLPANTEQHTSTTSTDPAVAKKMINDIQQKMQGMMPVDMKMPSMKLADGLDKHSKFYTTNDPVEVQKIKDMIMQNMQGHMPADMKTASTELADGMKDHANYYKTNDPAEVQNMYKGIASQATNEMPANMQKMFDTTQDQIKSTLPTEKVDLQKPFNEVAEHTKKVMPSKQVDLTDAITKDPSLKQFIDNLKKDTGKKDLPGMKAEFERQANQGMTDASGKFQHSYNEETVNKAKNRLAAIENFEKSQALPSANLQPATDKFAESLKQTHEQLAKTVPNAKSSAIDIVNSTPDAKAEENELSIQEQVLNAAKDKLTASLGPLSADTKQLVATAEDAVLNGIVLDSDTTDALQKLGPAGEEFTAGLVHAGGTFIDAGIRTKYSSDNLAKSSEQLKESVPAKEIPVAKNMEDLFSSYEKLMPELVPNMTDTSYALGEKLKAKVDETKITPTTAELGLKPDALKDAFSMDSMGFSNITKELEKSTNEFGTNLNKEPLLDTKPFESTMSDFNKSVMGKPFDFATVLNPMANGLMEVIPKEPLSLTDSLSSTFDLFADGMSSILPDDFDLGETFDSVTSGISDLFPDDFDLGKTFDSVTSGISDLFSDTDIQAPFDNIESAVSDILPKENLSKTLGSTDQFASFKAEKPQVDFNNMFGSKSVDSFVPSYKDLKPAKPEPVHTEIKKPKEPKPEPVPEVASATLNDVLAMLSQINSSIQTMSEHTAEIKSSSHTTAKSAGKMPGVRTA